MAKHESYKQRCLAADAAERKACGWSGMAWVGVNFAPPETPAEQRALDFVQKRFPQHVTVHVYELVDLLAEMFEQGTGPWPDCPACGGKGWKPVPGDSSGGRRRCDCNKGG
jgi:hypothetical protein